MKLHIYLALIFIMGIHFVSVAQEQGIFDYQVQQTDSTEYRIDLELYQSENVQFINISFLFSHGWELETQVASLNRKSDGYYYLFLNNEEYRVSPEYIQIEVRGENPDVYRCKEIRIELETVNFESIASRQKSILKIF